MMVRNKKDIDIERYNRHRRYANTDVDYMYIDIREEKKDF